MKLDDLEKEYYTKLELFKSICMNLNKKRLYYNTIMLNHELYRFLYPIEPYLDFKYKEPVKEVVSLIGNLCDLGTKMLSSIQGYPNNKDPIEGHDKEDCLEQRTSNLYTSLWEGYSEEVILNESKKFILYRLGSNVIDTYVKGKRVLDLGCGSGRNTLALSLLGAGSVTGMDYHRQSYQRSEEIGKKQKLNVVFKEGNALSLPFEKNEFDFVYSNGVLHHTKDWKVAINEYFRVMKTAGFIYLYATGGFFWSTRKVMREIFLEIPQKYCLNVLRSLDMPPNRMIFMDVWYVPIEDHIAKSDLEGVFAQKAKSFKKLVSNNPFDLDKAIMEYAKEGPIFWGEGEHRYLVEV